MRGNKLFKKYPLKYLYVHSSRQLCSRNADFENYKATTQFYAWYVWEKGFKGDTIIKWIDNNKTEKEDGIPPTNKLVGILPKRL